MQDGTLTPFDTAAVLVVAAAALGYVNHRWIGLPHTVGLTVTGLVASLAVIGLDALAPTLGLGVAVRGVLAEVDFHAALMEGMLSFLLFAGALHVNLDALLRRWRAVAAMATLGVAVSTLIAGFGFWGLAAAFGLGLPLVWALVFGALISPTDPVAVFAALKQADVPVTLEAKVAGESLFNDGVGIVVFAILVAAATGDGGFDAGAAVLLFLQEAVGGAVLGFAAGCLAYLAMRRLDEHNLEVLITLAVVMGGYALAHALHVSGPIAMAVAGLLIGNHGARFAMSEATEEHVRRFWSLVDEMLNAVLFLLIGLEVVAIAARGPYLLAGLAAIPLVLLARAAAVGAPLSVLARFVAFTRGAFPVLVWGGLRGAIPVALALSLPAGPEKEAILTVTYVVVLFSVVVQGSTMAAVARRFAPGAEREEPRR